MQLREPFWQSLLYHSALNFNYPLMDLGLISAVEAVAKVVGWASNFRRERLKKRIWDTLQQAGPQGLDATGIHTRFMGEILAGVPLSAVWGGAKNQSWLEIRNKWRVATKLPTVGQISEALYELLREGTIRHLGGGRYAI